jgi:arginine decarboxylase
MNPTYRGAGRWAGSAGENAKFGLALDEIIEAIRQLKAKGMQNCVKLLHFHMGSQITSINAIKRVMKEAARVFTELYRLCPSIEFLDVGGGLGVDYDGSSTHVTLCGRFNRPVVRWGFPIPLSSVSLAELL